MAINTSRLRRIREDPTLIVDPKVVTRACRRVGHHWRRRRLDPCSTLRAFVAQVANGNTAITDLVRILGQGFSPSAYCQARQRLPCAVVKAVLDEFTKAVRPACDADSKGLWHGHRTLLMDGTGVVMPDTRPLRKKFGTASAYGPGCGLPLAHVLTLFDAYHGLLLDMSVARGQSNDLRHVRDLHPTLRRGDVVVGDRGLCGYTYLADLMAKGVHGVFRVGKSRNIPFPASPGPRRRNAYNRHRSEEPVLVKRLGTDDQVIQIVKPHNRAEHIPTADFARIPSKLVVRAVRYRVQQPGFRSREVTLLTTLLDPEKYPAKSLAELYLSRWRIEQNIRHLKRTLGMERLKCQSLEGIKRELAVFALVYNAVCAARVLAARDRGVEPRRISFVDTLRWLRHAGRGAPIAITTPTDLLILPVRPPRIHPRQRKRTDSPFPVMKRPRSVLIRSLLRENSPR